MCFSASVSFAASALLGGSGIVAIKKSESPRMLAFASLPIIFGVQQLTEGILWLTFSNPELGYWHHASISMQDETRHMDLCVAMYNEIFRKGGKSERFRNQVALKMLMKSVYGDKTEDHHLIQAFRAFGIEPEILYGHVVNRLSWQLGRISMYVRPERLLELLGRK